MATNLAKSGAVKSLFAKVTRNQHTMKKVFNKNSFPAFRQSVFDTNPYAYNSYYWKSKNHFFGSKKGNEQESQQKQQEEQNNKQESQNKQEQREEKPEQKKTESKNANQPESFEGLLEEVASTPEIKKKLHSLYVKLEEQNIVSSKKIKELNDAVQSLEKSTAEARSKLGDLRDRLKEEIEERELMRKRIEKEIDNTKVYAITKFAKDLLEIPDNLDRALEAAKKLEGTGDQLYEGVKATKHVLLHVLERHGISQINPKGQIFDPNQHEALFDFLDPNQTPGSVGVVCTVGYKIQDRILRPAKVGIVKEPERVEGKH